VLFSPKKGEKHTVFTQKWRDHLLLMTYKGYAYSHLKRHVLMKNRLGKIGEKPYGGGIHPPPSLYARGFVLINSIGNKTLCVEAKKF